MKFTPGVGYDQIEDRRRRVPGPVKGEGRLEAWAKARRQRVPGPVRGKGRPGLSPAASAQAAYRAYQAWRAPGPVKGQGRAVGPKTPPRVPGPVKGEASRMPKPPVSRATASDRRHLAAKKTPPPKPKPTYQRRVSEFG